MRNHKNRTPGRLLTAVAVSALAILAVVFSASPAAAAPYWQEVRTGPTWNCGSTETHTVSDGVGFQTCIVYNANQDAQAVLVVVNNATNPIRLSGEVDTSFGATFSCLESTLNPGFRRGCFGPTTHVGFPPSLGAYTQLTVNGVVDDHSVIIYR